ncbi:hypothetical protein ACR6HW_08975 [Fusibacter sp. JL298sf-3]
MKQITATFKCFRGLSPLKKEGLCRRLENRWQWGNWIKWLLLCFITLGIYSFWLSIALERWKVKNTVFAD